MAARRGEQSFRVADDFQRRGTCTSWRPPLGEALPEVSGAESPRLRAARGPRAQQSDGCTSPACGKRARWMSVALAGGGARDPRCRPTGRVLSGLVGSEVRPGRDVRSDRRDQRRRSIGGRAHDNQGRWAHGGRNRHHHPHGVSDRDACPHRDLASAFAFAARGTLDRTSSFAPANLRVIALSRASMHSRCSSARDRRRPNGPLGAACSCSSHSLRLLATGAGSRSGPPESRTGTSARGRWPLHCLCVA